MKTGIWDIFFNILLFIFWFRIFCPDDRNTYFNAYLSSIYRISDKFIEFLRPAFPMVPRRLVALISFIFLLVLRGMAIPNGTQWVLLFGFERAVDTSDLSPCVVFSLLSFMVFLFKIWGLSLIYVRSHGAPLNHPAGMLHHVSLPFTRLRPDFRPIALLCAGIVLVAAVDLTGQPYTSEIPGLFITGLIDWQGDAVPVLFFKLFIVAIAAWAQILIIIQQVMILLIITSWISMFTASAHINNFCREWLDFLLGPMRKYPVRIGMLDMSPVVFFFFLMFLHSILMGILINSFDKL